MKKIYLLFLVATMATYGQRQIGADINGEAANDESGAVSISADGTVVAIGAAGNDGNGEDSGHVRVYKNVSGVWTQIGADINGEAAGDYSGRNVSLSFDGSIVAIGASNNDGNGTNSGHVRVFKNVANVWTQIGADINGEAVGDYSGGRFSLSADGTVVAIAAPSNAGNGNSSGHVRIFKNVSDVWTQIGSDIDGRVTGDYCGWGITLSPDATVVAFAGFKKLENSSHFNHVRVYKNINNVWTQIGADIDGINSYDEFGSSISLSSNGSTIAIGSSINYVKVFRITSGVWTQIGSDINGYSPSLSLDGNIVAIGSANTSSGNVKIYKNSSDVWTQIGNNIDGEAAGDNSGSMVSLSSDGSFVAIGAPYNDGNGTDSGHVRVYDLSTLLSSDTFVLNNFSIYPNPSQGVLNISLKENLELHQVTIYNTSGQVVKKATTPVISTSELAKGSYFVEVVTNSGKAARQLKIE